MRRRVLSAFALACVVVLLAAQVGGAIQTDGAVSVSASQEDPAKANALLDDAAWYIEVKDPAGAQQRILAALAAARTNEEVRKRAGKLWAQASDQAVSAVFWKSWDIIWTWALNILLVVLVLLALWLLLRGWRHVWATSKNYSWRRIGGYVFSHWRSSNSFREAERKAQDEHKELRRWVVGAFNDETKLGVAEAVTTSIGRWKESSAPASAGLLKLGTMQLPSVPQLELPEVQVDLTPALEALPLTIGGIKLESVGKAIGPLKNWFDAKRLWIRGSASTDESTVVVRLTRRNANDTTDTVTATAQKSKAAEAAESASFKMYYLIAKDSSVADADGADKLRNGLKLLAQYVSGRDPKQLEAAYETLRDARSDNPALDEAYLYEGVALDMMERHDEAITRFEYILESDADQEIKAKAKYNKAVSLFREYRPEKLEESIQLLGELSGLGVDSLPQSEEDVISSLVESPIKALAYAAEANAVAHKPIFWRHYAKVPNDADKETIKPYKTAALNDINSWVLEVKTIAGRLDKVLKSAKAPEDAKAKTEGAGTGAANTEAKTAWDVNTRQQLKWAIQNALGNVQLNCAARFYTSPHVSEDEPKLRKQALEDAEDAFRRCEMLLPPGVETLTNLATVLMELKHGEESRGYSKRAIDLNPDYEYAYYRLAQAWERDSRIDELVKVLRSFARDRTPSIPSFRDLYSRHAVELAKFPAEATGDDAVAPAATAAPQAATNTATGQS